VSADPGLDRGDRAFSSESGDGNFWFQTTNADGSPIFTAPAEGTFANSAMVNVVHRPGIQSWNAAVFKDFGIMEDHKLRFRAEFFNFPNHPDWGNVNTNPTSSRFGQVTSKSGNRQVQLSLRYSF
jgi:hypothetical protein